MNRVVLASASPRRKALLEALGIHLEVIPSGAEEIFEGSPESMVVVNARVKRDDVAGRLTSPALVIAADTLVFFEGQPLGKPVDRNDAFRMLRQLSGQTHEVLTGLAVVNTATGLASEGVESTEVTFRPLSAEEIELFIDAVNPLDRAGSYTADGPGSLLIERFEGCYNNVLGLPIVRLDLLLRMIGESLFGRMVGERSRFL